MHYLITGAAGLVGSAFVNNLDDKIHQISCLIHHKVIKPFKNKRIRIVKGDLSNFNSLFKASSGADIIIHCAAAINETTKQKYYKINHLGTINLLKAAQKNRVKKFIYFSSWAVNPKAGDYAKSKLLAENEVKQFPNHLIIRPADIYGKNKSHLLNFISLIKSFPLIPVISDGNYIVSPIFVDDLIKAAFYLIENNRQSVFTLIGPRIYTYNQLISLILKSLNMPKPVIHLPNFLVYPPVYLADKLSIPLPINIERYKRLTTQKVMDNLFDYKKARIQPLRFENALKKFLLKNLSS